MDRNHHRPHHHWHHCHHWHHPFLMIAGAIYLWAIGVGYLLQGLLVALTLTALTFWLYGAEYAMVVGSIGVFLAIVWWAMP